MSGYAAKSSYEFTDSPKRVASPALTPKSQAAEPETPQKEGSVSSFFSSKWGSWTAKAQEVAQKAKASISDYISSNPSTPSSNNNNEQDDLAYAPWEHLGVEDPIIEFEIRNTILSLTNNPRHLLNAPPEDDEGIPFKLEDWIPVTLVALRKSSGLRDARYSLVPSQISEQDFWRNYFFRVNTIKRAYSISEAPQLKIGAPQALAQRLDHSASSPAVMTPSSSPYKSNPNHPINTSVNNNSSSNEGSNSPSTSSTPQTPSPQHPQNDAHTTQNHDEFDNFVDLEDTGSWGIPSDYTNPVAPRRNPISDEILKALED